MTTRFAPALRAAFGLVASTLLAGSFVAAAVAPAYAAAPAATVAATQTV